MNRSKKHSDNSTQPKKIKQESKDPTSNTEIHAQPLNGIMVTLMKWSAVLGLCLACFVFGIYYHELFVNKDVAITELKKEIDDLMKKSNTLSKEKSRLEENLQYLNKNINNLTQANNTLKRSGQILNDKIDEINRKNNFLEKENEKLSSLPPIPVDTTLYTVKIVFTGFDLFQKPEFKIFLDGKQKSATTEKEYTLSAGEGVYNLEIQYKTSAKKIWEYSDSITFNESTSQKEILKSHFEIKH